MRALLIFLIAGGSSICLAQTNGPADILDPMGNTVTAGTDLWFYWSGFFVGCGFFLFGLVKRMAQRTVGSSDF